MKIVVITGCSSGIGLEAALAFARAGDCVYATMRDLNKADILRQKAATEGLDIDISALDVTKPASFSFALDAIIKRAGHIDVLVNNAGILPVGAFEDIDEATLRQVMETNFFGPALLTRAILPHMRARRQGYIIMVGSLSGFAAKAGDSVYSASKFALEGLTEGFHHEVARWNIKTAIVQPGQYQTNIFTAKDSGTLGSCREDSAYYPLIQLQQKELCQNLPNGFSPVDLAQMIVDISRSDGSRFRWPADPVAKRVSETIFAQSDAEREAFLRKVARIDWWISGASHP
jgi:NAD(P)-dependent dehydrogenase (short-subunit alcohol dehydrogenase family)